MEFFRFFQTSKSIFFKKIEIKIYFLHKSIIHLVLF